MTVASAGVLSPFDLRTHFPILRVTSDAPDSQGDIVPVLLTLAFSVSADQRLYYNATPHLEHTVPDYLNGVVLQRHNLAQPENSFGHIKFQVAFNLAVVWMIVFVSLSKGKLPLPWPYCLLWALLALAGAPANRAIESPARPGCDAGWPILGITGAHRDRGACESDHRQSCKTRVCCGLAYLQALTGAPVNPARHWCVAGWPILDLPGASPPRGATFFTPSPAFFRAAVVRQGGIRVLRGARLRHASAVH